MRYLLLLFLCLSASAQSQKQPASNKQSPQQQIQKPAANQPVSNSSEGGTGAAQGKMPTDTHEQQHGNQGVKEINDTLLMVFTGVLAIFACMQWRVLCKHEEWMQKHDAKLEELAQSAKDNADTAKRNTDAAVNAERAWVVAEIPPITQIASGQAPWTAIVIKNRGRTIARIIERGENFSVQPNINSLPEIPDYGRSISWPDGVVLPPSPDAALSRLLRVSDWETWQQVEKGSQVLFIFGFIKYLDAFNEEHETRYIYRFDTSFGRRDFYIEGKKHYNKAT